VAASLERADRLRRMCRYALESGDTFLHSAFMELCGDPITNSRRFPIEALEDLIDPKRPITYGILKPGPEIPGGVRYIRAPKLERHRERWITSSGDPD
jgi:type I restriction enzyme S subunit